MKANNTRNNIQAEPGASPYFFGCKKRVEYLAFYFIRYTGSIINYGDLNVFIVPLCNDLQFTLIVYLHCIDGIIDKISPHLVKLAYKCLYRWQGSIVFFVNFYI